MSLSDWLAVFKSSGKEFLADDCMGLSQQVAYSSLLAFFPAMIFLIAFLDLIGVSKIKKGTPPLPEQAIEEARRTTDVLKANGK